jgi:hypothetical protein
MRPPRFYNRHGRWCYDGAGAKGDFASRHANAQPKMGSACMSSHCQRRIIVNAGRFTLLLLVLLIQGCNACWITKPANPIEAVTLYEVRFHRYFQPGSFSALLDGENVTAQFAPTPAQSGSASMVRNAPFTGGETLGVYISPPPILLPSGGHIEQSQNQGPSSGQLPSGERAHTFSVSCDAIPGVILGHGDSVTFYPLHFTASLPSPVNIPPGGAALNMTLAADRPLSAPVAVTISAHLLGSTPGPANHIRINGAAPGAPVVVTLSPGGAPAPFYVQSVSPGGFWLRLEAPGAQVGSVTGVAH